MFNGIGGGGQPLSRDCVVIAAERAEDFGAQVVRLGVLRVEFRGTGDFFERVRPVPSVEEDCGSENVVGLRETVVELDGPAARSFGLRQDLPWIQTGAECADGVILTEPRPAEGVIRL